jgi:hypothetical protein
MSLDICNVVMAVVEQQKKQNEILVKLLEAIDRLDDHLVSLTVAVEEHK